MEIKERNLPLSFDSREYPLQQDNKTQFLEDVIKGLLASPKRLQSKYFYDKKGDELFQKIMHCPEYYLTRSEMEIFRKLTSQLASQITKELGQPFDLIELGVGDGTKSKYLLRYLLRQGVDFNYFPIDISGNILSILEENFRNKLPELNMVCLQGEYFEMLKKAALISDNRKVVMFLGGNIGNMTVPEAEQFCLGLRELLNPGDLVLMGFDLKKNPQVILDAYNDKGGLTSDFNLNLLSRINRELEGNFDLKQFRHYQTYDPDSGACKSYLVSRIYQKVLIADVEIPFSEGETIFMEVSQKYSMNEIQEIAEKTGFRMINRFMDSKQWFTDVVWAAV